MSKFTKFTNLVSVLYVAFNVIHGLLILLLSFNYDDKICNEKIILNSTETITECTFRSDKDNYFQDNLYYNSFIANLVLHLFVVITIFLPYRYKNNLNKKLLKFELDKNSNHLYETIVLFAISMFTLLLLPIQMNILYLGTRRPPPKSERGAVRCGCAWETWSERIMLMLLPLNATELS